MAEFFFPFDTGAGASVTQSEWQRMAQYFERTGVCGDPASGSLRVSAPGTSMSTIVTQGEAFVRGFFYYTDANITLTHAANNDPNSYARIDLVVLRLDVVARTIHPVIVQGTPASTPVAPSPTYPALFGSNTYELPLAQVRVEAAAATIASTKVTDARLFISLDLMTSLNSASRDNANTRYGTIRYEADQQQWVGWNGTAWVNIFSPRINDAWTSYAPTFSGLTVGGDAKRQGRYKLLNSTTCALSIFFKLGNQTFSNKDLMLTLPFPAAGGHTQIMPFFWQDSSTSPHKRGTIAEIDSGSSTINRLQITGASTADLDTFRTIGAFDELYVSGVYEVAPQ